MYLCDETLKISSDMSFRDKNFRFPMQTIEILVETVYKEVRLSGS